MATYRIRGQVTKQGTNDTISGGTSRFFPDVIGLRVEAWDKDVRFDDRLGHGKTNSQGDFEIYFTDEAYRQEPLEAEINPDLFFQVFRGRELVGSTEQEIILFGLNSFGSLPALPAPGSSESLQPSTLTLIRDGITTEYRLQNLEIDGILEESPQRKIFELPPTLPDRVIDVLPTLDQITESGIRTTLTPADGQGGSLQQIVDGALGEVLGRNLKTGDAKMLLTSLTQAFSAKENNGRTDYVWTPRAYATVQTELGGMLTGAQASLYHRAKVALNEMLPLLNKLYPMDSAADPQNIEAARSIVRTEITELVNEMGTQGGPRAHRVETLFHLLIGDVDATEPERVGGQLKDLADMFGLTRSRINTVDEEQNYSNFLIIRDYIVSLRSSWNAYIDNSGAGAFVGPQLVLLSQSLSVVAESVQEVYRIMDLVFLGPAERQAVWIDFTQARDLDLTKEENNGRFTGIAFLLPDRTGYPISKTVQLVPPMTVESLLSWAWQAATKEWPILAKEGGKLGIAKTIAQTADRLMILIQAASYVPIQNTAFRRAGVLRALRDLAFQVYQVKRLAEALITPLPPYGRDDLLGLKSGQGYGVLE
jgi:hypothetical protein